MAYENELSVAIFIEQKLHNYILLTENCLLKKVGFFYN